MRLPYPQLRTPACIGVAMSGAHDGWKLLIMIPGLLSRMLHSLLTALFSACDCRKKNAPHLMAESGA